jgi:hypothetical protein
MTVGGQGIPRLQELAYLETVAVAVDAGHNLEGIRLAVVEHIWAIRNSTPGDDLPDPALYRVWRSDEKKFIRNVTDSLKELMRLGFVRKAILPSSGRSAYAHKDAKYDLMPAGRQWVQALSADRRQAYEDLLPQLIRSHPGFEHFLTTVGTIGDYKRQTFVVPLLRWSKLPSGQRSQRNYREAIGQYVADSLASSDLGWKAEAHEIAVNVNNYLDDILARAQAQGRDPFVSVRAFTKTCEKALVKLAFTKAGYPIDHLSVEMAARWSRWLGLASFTYLAPGPYALRYWSTAHIDMRGNSTKIERRAGGEFRDRALDALNEYCQQARAAGTTYVSVWEARAAVCWKLRIVDDEFDRAVTEMIARRRGQSLNWRVHLDQFSIGSMPPSATPFVLTTATAGTRTYNVMTVVPKTNE